MTFNLTAFEAAYWDEVGYLAHLRKHPSVSPFSRQVAHAVLTAGLLALEDGSRGNRVHRTLASGTGTGKSSCSWAFGSALLKSDPTASVLFVCPDIRQAEDTYIELSKLIDESEMAIWTSGHDAGTPMEKIRSSCEGFEPTAPRFWKSDLHSRRCIVVTHRFYTDRGGIRGVSYLEEPRTIHLIDERLAEVRLVDIDQGDVAKARDASVSANGEHAPMTKAFHDLHVHLNTMWESEATQLGAPFKAMQNTSLNWFTTEEAKSAENHAATPSIAQALAFGRSLVTGHAFLARYPEATKGGRFLGYRLDLPVIPGTVLLDGTSDIDGVNQIATWRAPVAPPRATFERLSIKHIPFPVVDPDGYRKTVAQITDNVELATRYATWIKETVLAETQPGESVLVVTHKAMIEQGRLPRKLSFDDPMVLDGDRRVAFLTYGRGVGSNRYKEATTVVLCGEFWRPHRVSMGKAMGLANVPASHPYLGEMSNVNTRQALFTTIKNGDLLMWSKQLAMRGSARNFDEHGVCGRMKLVAIGELDLWMQSHKLMFPGASFDMSEETKAKAKAAGGAQAVSAFILAYVGDSFTSKELCEATGVQPANLAKYLKSPTVKAALASTGLSHVPGGGRGKPGCFLRWLPAIAAE